MSFSAYLYDTQNQLVTTQSSRCVEKLTAKLFHLLELFPLGTVGIIYDHNKEQVVGNYSRRVIE